MMDRNELITWLQTLPEGTDVAIDDGGLTLVALVELADGGDGTGTYIEVGGIPGSEEDECRS